VDRADAMVRLREGLAHLPWDYEIRVDADVRLKRDRDDDRFAASMYRLEQGWPIEVRAEGGEIWVTLTLDDFITAWAELGLGTEDHDWDCDDADTAIQQALFGDLVFG
jgi:hypothetical protein